MIAEQITRPANLNPPRRQRTYPRVVKRHRHANLYRQKKTTDTGTRHHTPPTIRHHPATATRSN
jgi:hypothetical protein